MVGIGDRRIGPVDLYFFLVGEAIGIRVRHGGIGPVCRDLLPIHQPIAIRVRHGGIGAMLVHLGHIGEPIPIRIDVSVGTRRIRVIEGHLVSIGQTVPIGVP